MKAITILQPWAHAIVHYGKRIENRTWSYPAGMLGAPLAIHAGARSSLDLEALDYILPAGEDLHATVEAMTYGAVVAVAKVGPVLRKRPSGQQGEWWAGPLAWKLDDLAVLPTPVPVRGAQGLWTLPEGVEEHVTEGWAKADGVW